MLDKLDRSTGAGEDQFLDHLAHDLNAPITYLLGYSEMLVEGQLCGEAAREAAGEIFREACRMSDLVAVMLETARARGGRLRVAPVPVGVADLLARLDRRWRLARPDVRLAGTAPAGLTVLADPDRFLLALHTLVSLAAGAAGRDEATTVVRLAVRPTDKGGCEATAAGPFADLEEGGAARSLALEALGAIAVAHGGRFHARKDALVLALPGQVVREGPVA